MNPDEDAYSYFQRGFAVLEEPEAKELFFREDPPEPEESFFVIADHAVRPLSPARRKKITAKFRRETKPEKPIVTYEEYMKARFAKYERRKIPVIEGMPCRKIGIYWFLKGRSNWLLRPKTCQLQIENALLKCGFQSMHDFYVKHVGTVQTSVRLLNHTWDYSQFWLCVTIQRYD